MKKRKPRIADFSEKKEFRLCLVEKASLSKHCTYYFRGNGWDCMHRMKLDVAKTSIPSYVLCTRDDWIDPVAPGSE